MIESELYDFSSDPGKALLDAKELPQSVKSDVLPIVQEFLITQAKGIKARCKPILSPAI